jgi:hydrogenase-4 transcriptional activator
VLFDGVPSNNAGDEFESERFQKLLLSVWREACRHIELSESTATIAESLSGDLPLDFVLVRFFDGSIRGVRTLAVGQAQPKPFHLTPDTIVSPSRWERLLAWAARGDVVASPASRRTGEVSIIVPPELEGDVLVGPLVGRDGPVGALVFTAQHSRAFREADVELFRLLMEPFSVAFENHLRLHELSSLREAADSEKRRLLKRLGKSEISDDVIVGADGGLRSVMERVDLVSTSDVPILILGETGTGKEVVSRAIHNRSSRASGPFIRVNCGAIPSELLDSQLFGHERGSFTGADATRQGWFERADGGTLFLDEIGELPPAAQVRLLRVLQDSFIERVGGQNPIRVDVRIVAATHRDLPTMVRSGHFREDLWYRVNVFPLLMPPLRDRVEDIPLLARHFTMRAATHGKGVRSQKPERPEGCFAFLTPDPLSVFTWPRNSITNGVAGWWNTSSGAPTCSILALFMITTRSATSSASSWSCVTSTVVIFSSVCNFRNQDRRFCLTLLSKAPNGSSSNKTLGSTAIARASATRCLCPPDNCEGYRSPRPSNWIRLNRWRTLSSITALAGRSFRGRTRKPNAMFSKTVMWRNNA